MSTSVAPMPRARSERASVESAKPDPANTTKTCASRPRSRSACSARPAAASASPAPGSLPSHPSAALGVRPAGAGAVSSPARDRGVPSPSCPPPAGGSSASPPSAGG
eukprot:4778094-Pleurochrysis_carterae.AAC.1